MNTLYQAKTFGTYSSLADSALISLHDFVFSKCEQIIEEGMKHEPTHTFQQGEYEYQYVKEIVYKPDLHRDKNIIPKARKFDIFALGSLCAKKGSSDSKGQRPSHFKLPSSITIFCPFWIFWKPTF